MNYYRAEEIDHLELNVGSRVELESLRQAVVPPYLMLMPFITVPDGITVTGQRGLDEDGVHVCVFILHCDMPTEGTISVGFRDIPTDEITHQKDIPVVVR